MANPAPNMSGLVPWKKGQASPNPGGLSRERRALYAAIEVQEVPKVIALLETLFEQAMRGDTSAAKLWLDHVRGPVKARDDDAIENAVEAKIAEMLSEARARRGVQSTPPVAPAPTTPDGGTETA